MARAMETKSAGEERKRELRRLPSVERLADAAPAAPRHLAIEAARRELEAVRRRVMDGDPAPDGDRLAAAVREGAARLATRSLRPLINATGVVLHTNLGRAPLAPEAVEAVASVAAAYCNLEYDLESGARGSRGDHLEPLLRDLCGAEAALAVNNNAAAVMLALAALAAPGEVIVSRGELVEIGGSFRIPEILANSGCRMVEVGTTNRTRAADYEAAIGERATAILKVHQSNFRIVGFAEQAAPAELAALAREHGLALVDDLGSGALAEVHEEPTLRAAVEAGADVVCCSGDKLLGGPQAGLIVGREEAVERCRRHPLARAMRLDKLQIAALEATLMLHRDAGRGALPALAMIDASDAELRGRAERTAERIGAAADVDREASVPGGGSLADVRLEGPVCAVDPGAMGAERLAELLRRSDPPVVARIVRGRLVLDPRTMSDEEAAAAAAAVAAALGER